MVWGAFHTCLAAFPELETVSEEDFDFVARQRKLPAFLVELGVRAGECGHDRAPTFDTVGIR
ncbi:hypothetical protein HMPREF3114_18485 [Stenotrophomonas sp. HMSC10F07]|nr:hypothetical protein HMPREF3114_18485 [Stenotrophomonas sp. HMSC10F07]